MTMPNDKRTLRMLLPFPRSKSSHHTIRHFLEAMKRHDLGLIEHGKRTAAYSLVLGRTLNRPHDDLVDLYQAGLLHDLGKLTLPNQVVQQNGLSMIGEYLMAECSPQAGAEILRPWPGLQRIAKIIALHHERWDGHGHPFGMRGNLIPIEARILSLADIVDQLFSQKDEPISDQTNKLVGILRMLSGTRFDPGVVEAFVNVFVPWIKHVGIRFAQEHGCAPEQRNTSSASTFTEFVLVHGGEALLATADGPSINSYLIDIIELTNPVSYDPTLTSP